LTNDAPRLSPRGSAIEIDAQGLEPESLLIHPVREGPEPEVARPLSTDELMEAWELGGALYPPCYRRVEPEDSGFAALLILIIQVSW
jgi:hypothetical protein